MNERLVLMDDEKEKLVDETGWKVNGASRWLWSVANKAWAYTRIANSRGRCLFSAPKLSRSENEFPSPLGRRCREAADEGHAVLSSENPIPHPALSQEERENHFGGLKRLRGSKIPKELLGHPFKGVLVSDFFSAYNKMYGLHQKCLVHLRRDIHQARGEDPPPDFSGPDKKFKRLLADADRLAERRDVYSRAVFSQRVRRLKARLFHFATAVYSHRIGNGFPPGS